MNTRNAPSPHGARPEWWYVALFGAVYLLGCEVGYQLSLGPGVGGTFWPPAGITLGALLVAPRRLWRWLILAGFVANLVSDQFHSWPLLISLGFAIANLAEPFVAALILRMLFGRPLTLTRLAEGVAFAVVASFIGAPLGATIGAVALEVATGSPLSFGDNWRTWWIGDTVGALVVAPLVVRGLGAWPRLRRVRPGRWLEAATLAAVLVAVIDLVFTAAPTSTAMPFLVFPVLLWASVRFGLTLVAGALLLVALLTTRDTALGYGPFAAPGLSPTDRLVALQLFLGVIAVSFQTLAILWEERTRALDALREANLGLMERYRRLVEQSPLAMQSILPDGRVKEVNEAWRRLWGATIPAAGHRSIRDDPQFDALGLRTFVEQAFAGQILDLPEVWLTSHTRPDADPRCLRSLIYPVKDDTGRVSEVVFVCRDTTDIVRAKQKLLETNQVLRARDEALSDALARMKEAQAHREELLEAERSARAEAERASRLKDEFLATLSHELRTPLNAILGWAQLLHRQTPDAATLTQAIDTIERNARAQARLIEELLDMSRITAGKVSLALQEVALPELVLAAVDSHRPAAAARQIRLNTSIDDGGQPLTAHADPARLHQVVSNLLANAIKFTPAKGEIHVSLARRGDAAEIVVRDTGQGIPADFLPHVFERFRQADGSITRQHGGLGLGLAIVRQITELHGGRAAVHSDGPGRGATFTVSLPLSTTTPAGTAPAAGDAPAAGLAGLRVLVVDDEPDARELLRRLLAEQECRVAVAASADEALSHLAEHPVDVLVSDIGMPRVDGYELLRRVHATMDGTSPKAVAVTAFARPEDRERVLAAGYQGHIAKPISPSRLLQALAELAPDRPVDTH